MAAHYIAAMMESGAISWGPKFTSGLSDDGPEDKRLIIDFNGILKKVPWITVTSYGFAVDMDALINSVPELFDKKWLRGKGLCRARIGGAGNSFVIDIKL